MSAANGTQRDIGLDLTRILAFLAVPSVHFFLNSTYYDTAIVGPRMALMTVMRTAFMVCVPLYMLLSGYLSAGKHIPLTRSGLLGYYKKLLPIFLTYCCIIPPPPAAPPAAMPSSAAVSIGPPTALSPPSSRCAGWYPFCWRTAPTAV